MIDTRNAYQAYPTPNMPMPLQLRAMANLEIRLAIAMQSDPAAKTYRRTPTETLIRKSNDDAQAKRLSTLREGIRKRREADKKRVLAVVRRNSPSGVTQISAAIGVSRAEAMDLAKELAERGLLKAEKTRQSGAWVYAVAA